MFNSSCKELFITFMMYVKFLDTFWCLFEEKPCEYLDQKTDIDLQLKTAMSYLTYIKTVQNTPPQMNL